MSNTITLTIDLSGRKKEWTQLLSNLQGSTVFQADPDKEGVFTFTLNTENFFSSDWKFGLGVVCFSLLTTNGIETPILPGNLMIW